MITPNEASFEHPNSLYSTMDVPFLKIGAKISIISKANVRYEGIFVEIDTENLQIALSDVSFYGTESRAAEVFIAGQERIYPYVIFKSSDINDIRVLNNTENEKPLAPVQMNGFVRRDYPQSTLEFLRTFPLAQFDASQNALQTPNYTLPVQRKFHSSRGIWTRCSQSPCSRGVRRSSPYMWRIPRVVDFIGRSGDPNELPVEPNGENFIFDQEYDFEKNNKLFEDLLNGIKELNLSNVSDDADDEEQAVVESPQLHQYEEEEKEPKIEEIIPNPDQGATPKKCEVYSPKPKLTPSAYNKSKSFFDTVSCASIYRSPNSNPNWREWNKETFGIPMIRHQRRKRRTPSNAIKSIEDDEKQFGKNTEKIISEEKTKCDIQTEENVTVQKIRFQAVVVTKTRGFKSSSDGTAKQNYEKNCKDELNAIEKDDLEKYSLKSLK